MDRPHFRFHPGAYETVFEQEEGVCSCCGQNRSLKYEGPFYSQQSPDYLCPWCIASGQACETYDGELVGYTDIEGVSPDPADPEPAIARELLLEVALRTPGYRAWQQPVWLTHCNEPCVFLGHADRQAVEPFLTEVLPDIEGIYRNDAQWMLERMSTDGMISGCLFRCVRCGEHRLHMDVG